MTSAVMIENSDIMARARKSFAIALIASLIAHALLWFVGSVAIHHTVRNVAQPQIAAFTVVRVPFPQASKNELAPTSAADQLRAVQTPAPTNPEADKTRPSSTSAATAAIPPAMSKSIPAPTTSVAKLSPPTETTQPSKSSPFEGEIDPKQAWINVAESPNLGLLQGVTIDVSGGSYYLSEEVDVRVRARGDLKVEYPVSAAVLGSEGVVYVMLLIGDQGQKDRVQILSGPPMFDAAVLQSLEPIEFLPAMLKDKPVASILLLEFEFRRKPPAIDLE